MQITPLEIGIAVTAVCVFFGPKKLPTFKRSKPATSWQTLSAADLGAANYAAGRAQSPVAARRASRDQHQFAVAGTNQAPLPHELLF
jgi:hypothetical protein